MFSVGAGEEVTQWFTDNLVNPGSFELPASLIARTGTIEPDTSHAFAAYIEVLKDKGYKVWDVQNNQHSTSYLRVTSENGEADIGGRADFYVTTSDASRADYHTDKKLLCVVEIQSKSNTNHCELQLLVYLLILMNTKGLQVLWGALIQTDGNCRMFKATRNNGNCIYEQDGLFHVSHFPMVFEHLDTSVVLG